MADLPAKTNAPSPDTSNRTRIAEEEGPAESMFPVFTLVPSFMSVDDESPSHISDWRVDQMECNPENVMPSGSGIERLHEMSSSTGQRVDDREEGIVVPIIVRNSPYRMEIDDEENSNNYNNDNLQYGTVNPNPSNSIKERDGDNVATATTTSCSQAQVHQQEQMLVEYTVAQLSNETDSLETIKEISTPCNASPNDAPQLPLVAAGASQQSLDIKAGFNFVSLIKHRTKNHPGVYSIFKDTMLEFKLNRIDYNEVQSRLLALFCGYPDLLERLSLFMSVPSSYLKYSQHLINQSQQMLLSTSRMSTRSVESEATVMPGLSSRPPEVAINTVVPIECSKIISADGLVGNVNIAMTPPLYHPVMPVVMGCDVAARPISSPLSLSTYSPTSSMQSSNVPIDYVSKIKERFHSQPEKYDEFLDIVLTHTKERQNERTGKAPRVSMSEEEVLNRVATLFEGHPDLLVDFYKYLPPTPPTKSTSNTATMRSKKASSSNTPKPISKPTPKRGRKAKDTVARTRPVPPKVIATDKMNLSHPPPKTSLAKAIKKKRKPQPASLSLSNLVKSILVEPNDSSFEKALFESRLEGFEQFDKIREILNSPAQFKTFLQIIELFLKKVISKDEMTELVKDNFTAAITSQLLTWFTKFLQQRELNNNSPSLNNSRKRQKREPDVQLPERHKYWKQLEEDPDFDITNCKRAGTNYYYIKDLLSPSECSGRTAFHNGILNDDWKASLEWTEDYNSEVRKLTCQAATVLNRMDDERYEDDMVHENIKFVIAELEFRKSQLTLEKTEDRKEWLKGDLGNFLVFEPTILSCYGEKDGPQILKSLETAPEVAVPVVLERLKEKSLKVSANRRERDAERREDLRRIYLKSLDYQGSQFKLVDSKTLRPKSILAELEMAHSQMLEVQQVIGTGQQYSDLQFTYVNHTILEDACDLILHKVRRQEDLCLDEKRKMKKLLKQFIPQFFNRSTTEMSDSSDDENVTDYSPSTIPCGEKFSQEGSSQPYTVTKSSNKTKMNDSDEADLDSDNGSWPSSTDADTNGASQRSNGDGGERRQSKDEESIDDADISSQIMEMDIKLLLKYVIKNDDEDESYRLFFANSHWFVFFRLHQILCERLAKLVDTMEKRLVNDGELQRDLKTSSAFVMGYVSEPEIKIEDSYNHFLKIVRNMLDGNIEQSEYEDFMREMFRCEAYIAFTIDKLISNTIRELYKLISEDSSQKCMESYLQAAENGGSGGSIINAGDRVREEVVYQQRSKKILTKANDHCVKVVLFEKRVHMTMELLDNKPIIAKPVKQERCSKNSRTKLVDVCKEKAAASLSVKESKSTSTRRRSTSSESTCIENRMQLESFKVRGQISGGYEGTRTRSKYARDKKIIHIRDPENWLLKDEVSYFYKIGSLSSAKENHRPQCIERWTRFKKWHEDWLLINTTRKDKVDIEAWLKSCPKNAGSRRQKVVKVIAAGGMDNVPYHLFKKYTVVIE